MGTEGRLGAANRAKAEKGMEGRLMQARGSLAGRESAGSQSVTTFDAVKGGGKCFWSWPWRREGGRVDQQVQVIVVDGRTSEVRIRSR